MGKRSSGGGGKGSRGGGGSSGSKTSLRGRSAVDGRFTTVEKARAQKNTHTVERVPKPGFGDTK